MDPMLLGETLSTSAANKKFYGFWMPAGGNDGVGGADVFRCSADGDFKLYMETKSSDQKDGDATTMSASATIDAAPALYKFDLAAARDLVRYRLESQAVGSIHFQFTQPMWAPN